MTRGRGLVSAAVVALALVATRQAWADEGPEASKRAGLQKFEEGLKAISAGDHGVALAAFDASNSLLPSPNSELYMARCYEALGKTASAHAMFLLAAEHAEERLVDGGERRYVATREAALREAAAIEGDVPKLAILVPPDAGEVVVKKNGAVVAAPAVLTATDPGHITIDVTGARLVPFHAELDLAKAESRRVDVRIEHVPIAVTDATEPSPRAATTSGTPPWMFWTAGGAAVALFGTAGAVAADERPAGGLLALGGLFGAGAVALALTADRGAPETRPLRPLAYALGGAGLAALGAGAYFGVQAKRADDAAAPHCPTLSTCDGVGVLGGQDAQDQAKLSTITFIAGAALLAGGVVVYFTAPGSGVTVAPMAGPKAAGLRVGGAW
jgi:hypothetical protein